MTPPRSDHSLSQVSEGQIISYATTNSQGSWPTSSLTAPSTTNVYSIQVNSWQLKAASTPRPTTTLSTITTSSISTKTAASQPTNTGGLSSAARTGIGIGVTIGFLLLAAFIIFLLMSPLERWRRSREAGPVEEAARAQGRARSPPPPPSPLPPPLEMMTPSFGGAASVDKKMGVGRSGSRRLAMSPMEMAGERYDFVAEV